METLTDNFQFSGLKQEAELSQLAHVELKNNVLCVNGMFMSEPVTGGGNDIYLLILFKLNGHRYTVRIAVPQSKWKEMNNAYVYFNDETLMYEFLIEQMSGKLSSMMIKAIKPEDPANWVSK